MGDIDEGDGLVETGKRHFKAQEIAPVFRLSEDRETTRLNADRREPTFR